MLTPAGAAKRALRSVARRWLELRDEITELSRDIKQVLDTIAAPLLERHGVGYETTGTLLCAAGDNPERLRTEAGYAALCGSAPVRVSSAKTNRHRLNRAGDRRANSAPWTIVMVRIRSDHPPTIAYLATTNDRRTIQTRSHPVPQALRRTRDLQRHTHHHRHHNNRQHRRLTPRGASDPARLNLKSRSASRARGPRPPRPSSW